ncbi:MAG: benzoyl-CoA-dihydrodiol lyase [Planctomycetes bacterium]|nr:benzoyl-CoA-dihydrodiol lyase [Planctomycetota bacterium]
MTDFETHPSRYTHWRLEIPAPGSPTAAVARLVMQVQEEKTFRPGYRLKLNSYDFGVDIELADCVRRLRFEHPEVKVVVVTSGTPRIFCAGANINMLSSSTHGFKVNFCKFTNETRCSIEDASAWSGLKFIAAVNGPCAGGGYELAAACDEIYLQDDGNSSVSLPEVPLLGVLPGTGGLTRLVDKRKVRRDRADVFCTLAEGLKAKRAKEWGFVDGFFPRSKFEESVLKRALALAATLPDRTGPGVELAPIAPAANADGSQLTYRYVTLKSDRASRTAELTVRGPETEPPANAAAMREAGSELWALRAFRELDDAICRLRLDEEEIGLVLLKTAGKAEHVLASDRALAANESDWFAREVRLHMARVLRRLDLSAKSLFAIIDGDSCFAGSLFEIALSADRIYMKNDPQAPASVTIGPLSSGQLPMSNGLSRLHSRFLANPAHATDLARAMQTFDADGANEAGLATATPDALDWDQEVRIAIEERASLSPDALTGMEASLRFGGPETTDSKIYGRLSAWQNWIFIRPNATGETGALKLYGQPNRPKFDWKRT